MEISFETGSIQISKPTLEDIPEMCALLDSIFGPNPKAAELYTQWFQDSEFHFLIAKDKEKLIGATGVRVDSQPKLERYESFGPETMDFISGEILGWFMSLAIDPQYRQQGIGKKLAGYQAQWLLKQNCSVLVGTSWQSGSHDNSSYLFESAGFQKLGESREFMRAQSREVNFTCVVCQSECQCKSTFYGIKTKEFLT